MREPEGLRAAGGEGEGLLRHGTEEAGEVLRCAAPPGLGGEVGKLGYGGWGLGVWGFGIEV